MSSETIAVALHRVLADRIPVEPSEAVAIVDAIWTVTAASADERGGYRSIPSAAEVVLTAFGDVEVDRNTIGDDVSDDATRITTALCRLLVTLVASGRIDDAGLSATTVEALRPVRAQAGAHDVVAVPYATPEALLAAWNWARVSDGSAALAHLYARWEIASAGMAAWPGPPSQQTRTSGLTAASEPGARPARRAVARSHVALAACVAMVLLVGLGALRLLHRAPGDVVATPGGYRTAAPVTPARDTAVVGGATDTRDVSAATRTAPVAPAAVSQTMTVASPRRVVGLADVGAAVYSPSFAPNGGALLFHSGLTRTGLHEAALRADGTISRVRTLLRNGARSYHVQIAPDGTSIAFDSDSNGTRAVYVAGRDGSGVRRVSGEGLALVPTWSPDGGRLAFVRAEPGRPRVWQLWTVDLRTHRRQQHTFHQVGQPWGGSWFPDGRHIAYSVERQLVVLDLQSGARRRYATPVPGRMVRTPAVSPDGRRIVFQVRQSGMWVLHLKSGAMVRVLPDRSAQEFAWSPDGRAIAYHSTRGGAWEIWTVPVG